MTKRETTLDCIENIKNKTDEVVLMCSLGKDSLVVLDMIYPHFRTIHCVFMYFVDNLEHINKWIRWVKVKYPNVDFCSIPHWNLSYILRSGLYCVPNPKVKLIKLADVCKALRRKYGCEYIFYGMKRSDSANRLLMLDRFKENHYEDKGNVYPLAEWNQREVMAYMKQNQLPEPVRYSKKASGGVGFDEDFFLWLRENCPSDLERIYKVFPMSRRILLEYDAKNGL